MFFPFLHIFDRFCGFLIEKGTNCAILNLNNRRLGHLKVHVILQTSLVLKGDPTKKIEFLSDQSLLGEMNYGPLYL